jgi:hypothetical protein
MKNLSSDKIGGALLKNKSPKAIVNRRASIHRICLSLLIGAVGLTVSYTVRADNPTLLSGLGGKCLDAAGANPNDGTRIILWQCRKGAANQQWRFWSNRTVRGLANKCLDVSGGNSTDGTPVILWTCHGGPNQQWQLMPDHTIRGLAGKCLDVTGANANNGTGIILWTCHGGPNQQWKKTVFFD